LAGADKPLSLQALDAAISESIGGPVRRDRLERDDRVFRWIVRRAEREGDCFRTTYAEAAKGAGYDVDPLVDRAARKAAKRRRVSTIRRAFDSLAGAALIEVSGIQKENGQWRCLEIRVRRYARGTPPCGVSQRVRRVSTARRVAPAGTRRSMPNARPARARGQVPSRARESVHRIFFSGRSGYSPAVGPTDQTATQRGPTRARARAPVRERAPGARSASRIRGSNLRRLLERRGDDWPVELFELRHPQLVELVDAFEAAFDRPARFSFEDYAEKTDRSLRRFDRFAGRGALNEGTGVREITRVIEALGAEQLGSRDGRIANPNGTRTEIVSLAYFVPILDEMSKDRRRHWKRHQDPDRP